MDASAWISLASLAVASGAVGALAAFGRKAKRLSQMADAWEIVRQMATDWHGAPERRDPVTNILIDHGRASFPGRVAALEAQLQPNGGQSMHDQMRRIALALESVQRNLAAPPTPPAPRMESGGMGFSAELVPEAPAARAAWRPARQGNTSRQYEPELVSGGGHG